MRLVYYKYRELRKFLYSLLALVIIVAAFAGAGYQLKKEEKKETVTVEAEKKKPLTDDVADLRPTVEEYTQKYGISSYTDYILAIIQVESDGLLEDVMQSSESKGLAPDSLSKEASIDQGCKHFSELLEKGKKYGVDIDTVVQAYNYGTHFINYVAENGKKYDFSLAQQYAAEKSNGRMTGYNQEMAIEKNGGWRYQYGNMFYALLVEQYV